jgi:predicted alpha/beta hydrolase family esterase
MHMASFAPLHPPPSEPIVLLVPGLNDSGPGHWQTRWERERDDCRRVELGRWADPIRNMWVNKLNLELQRASRPVVLVAHSLGCHAVAWWAEYEQPDYGHPVIGALLVAPPDVEDPAADPRLRRFAPVPETELPFPAIVVASRDDPYMPIGKARKLARTWNAQFADAGYAGHINAASQMGDWPFGQFLLSRLLAPRHVGSGMAEALLPSPAAFPSMVTSSAALL